LRGLCEPFDGASVATAFVLKTMLKAIDFIAASVR
jgi:hypothetical protein